MEKNGMFRVSLFGGYNKEDVQEYIKTLENEIDAVKVLHQKEKNELLSRLEEKSRGDREDEGEILRLKNELEQKDMELYAKEAELASVQDELYSMHVNVESENNEWEKIRGELRQREDELNSIRKDLEEKTKELINLQKMQEEEAENPPGEKADDDSLEYEAISKVLEDARKNAEMIEAEARMKADKILKKAKEEIKEHEKEIAERMDAELVNKGIQLFAAKHKITHYTKEVKRIQENLYNVYTSMNSMIESMPARLDDYWEGADYKMLEDDTNKSDQENNMDQSKEETSGEGNKEEGYLRRQA